MISIQKVFGSIGFRTATISFAVHRFDFNYYKNFSCKSLFVIAFILINLLSINNIYAVNYHIAVSGKSSGDGSANNPWDMVTGLSGSKGAPGDTLWLRGGIYKGHFVSRVKGNSSANIVVAQYPGEIAIIDGNIGIPNTIALMIYGSYTTYYGFQVMNSSNKRLSNISGSRPTDIDVNAGISVDGANNKLINLIVRDMIGNGIGFWKAAVNSEIYGNIIYNNGWQGPDRGHGHGIYTQNETTTKIIRDNIMFGGFGYGFHIYAENGGLKGFDIDGNVIFNSGSLTKGGNANIIIGGLSMADNILIRNNLTYKNFLTNGANIQVHYSNTLNGTLGFQNNIVVGGDAALSVKNWKTVNFSGNMIRGKSKIINFDVGSSYLSSYKWNNNSYYTTNTSNAMNGMTFDNWKKAYNFDGLSKFSTAKPSNEIIIKTNIYEKGSGTVVVYNHQNLTTVDVDLSKILAIGAEYEIRDVENYAGLPIITGKYNGGTLRIPMNLTSTDKPNGFNNVTHSDENFGVFVVRTTSKTSSPVVINKPPTLNIISNPSPINEDALSQTINLSGITTGGENQTLKVTASSDNITLIPNPTVNYTSPNSTGTLVFKPAPNRWGTANITVRVDDGGTSNNFITRTFTVTVNPINDAPTLNAINNLSIEGNSGTHTINLAGITAGSFESQKLVITASSNNASLIPNPTVVYTSPAATGSIKFAPMTNQSGTAIITVRITDDGSGTAPHENTFTRTFTVTVGEITYVNKFPTLNTINNPTAINEDAPEQTINLSGITAGEGESQKLIVTATSDNTILIPNVVIQYTSPNTTGSLKYKPAANRSGTARITVTVNDEGKENNLVSKTFTVTVNEINDAPKLSTISNLAVATNSPTKSISLTGINAGPFENQTVSIKATSSNSTLIPNPIINYSSPSTTGSLSFTPATNQSGSAVITIDVTDNGSGTSPHVNKFTQKFTVTVVEPLNKVPTLNVINNPAAIDEDALEQTINLSGITPGEGENQTLVVTAISDNTTLIPHPKVNYASPNTTGSISYKPTANRSGEANITVTVNDGSNLNNTITRTFTVKVNPVNDAPTLNSISNLSLEINAPLQTVSLTGISAGPFEDQALAISVTSNNTALIPHPKVEYLSPGKTGKILFTPLLDQTGTATITVKVTDNGSSTGSNVNIFTRTFKVEIIGNVAVLLPPTIGNINDINNIREDADVQSVQLNGIGAGSGDGRSLKVTAFSDKTGIIPNPVIEYNAPNSSGVLKFKPAPNKSGVVTITVKVENGNTTHNVSATTFKINVIEINDAPTLNIIANVNISKNSGNETIELSGITAGPGESQTLSITAISNNANLIPNPTVVYSSPNNTGSIRINPKPNASGIAIITVRVTDNGSNVTPHINYFERTFKITVADTDLPPYVSGLNLINTENGQVIMQLNDGDIIYTSKLPVPLYKLNIDALVSQNFGGSVVFGFNNNPKYNIENNPPYAIAGNTGKTYHEWNNGLIPGTQIITATTTSAKGGLGTLGTALSVSIIIIDDLIDNPGLGNISKLYLINSLSNEVIFELNENTVIEENELPVNLNQLNIKADFDSESIGSVVFGFKNNPRYNVENNAPYLIGGNTGNNANSWNGLTIGSHKITATSYKLKGGSGEAGITYSINIHIKNSFNGARISPKVLHINRIIPETKIYQFTKEDFNTAFVDGNGINLEKIKIVTLPSSGKLVYKGNIIEAGAEILTKEIVKMTYVPLNQDDINDTFTWNGSNGISYAEEVASVKLTPIDVNQTETQFELVKFWPNPAQEKISINFTAPSENIIQIYINDMKGQIVKTFTSNIISGNNEITLNVDDLKGGIYTVSLIDDYNKINLKMIKKD